MSRDAWWTRSRYRVEVHPMLLRASRSSQRSVLPGPNQIFDVWMCRHPPLGKSKDLCSLLMTVLPDWSMVLSTNSRRTNLAKSPTAHESRRSCPRGDASCSSCLLDPTHHTASSDAAHSAATQGSRARYDPSVTPTVDAHLTTSCYLESIQQSRQYTSTIPIPQSRRNLGSRGRYGTRSKERQTLAFWLYTFPRKC
jgi:hypothetical protein